MKSKPAPKNTVETLDPLTDVSDLEALGNDVIEAMQATRELLDARAQALEHCRLALVEHHDKLANDRGEVEQREGDLRASIDGREHEIAAREEACDELKRRLDERLGAAETAEAELNGRKSELDAVRAKAASREEELARQQESLEVLESRIARQRAETDAGAQQFAAKEAELDAARQSLAERTDELDARQRDELSRSTTLSETEADLNTKLEKLEKQRSEFESARRQGAAALEQREAKLAEMESSIAQRQSEAAARQDRLDALQRECDRKMAEVESARGRLADLRTQIRSELEKAVTAGTDAQPLLAGAAVQTDSAAAGNAGDLASVADVQARESVERFQKLCRDARRRVVAPC